MSGTLLARADTLSRLLKTKRIGFIGALALIFNSASGPGVPFTASNFQSPGFLYTTLIYLVFVFISGFSVLFIIEAIQAIPGNLHFQGTVEYATLINFYFEPWQHITGQVFLYGALQSNAIQNIILASQASDQLLVALFGKTCGLALDHAVTGWVCVSHTGNLPSPFGYTFMLFTLGFLIVMVLVIPLGIMNMDDNLGVQIGAFFISILILIQWCSSSFITGLDLSKMPIIAPPSWSYGQVVGTVMLNLAITTIIPSWINLKRKDVNAQHVVWTSLSFVTCVFVGFGCILALGFDIGPSNNILPVLSQIGPPVLLSKITVFLFAYVMLIPSIPVNLIISKGNLFQNKVTSEAVAIVLSYVFPWIISIPLQTGVVLLPFQSWTSLIFVSVSNFIVPILIYLRCHVFRRDYNRDRSSSNSKAARASQEYPRYIQYHQKLYRLSKKQRVRHRQARGKLRYNEDLAPGSSCEAENSPRRPSDLIAEDHPMINAAVPGSRTTSPLSKISFIPEPERGPSRLNCFALPQENSSLCSSTVRFDLPTAGFSEEPSKPIDLRDPGDDRHEDGQDGSPTRMVDVDLINECVVDNVPAQSDDRDEEQDTPHYLLMDVPDPDMEYLQETQHRQIAASRRTTIVSFLGTLGRQKTSTQTVSSEAEDIALKVPRSDSPNGPRPFAYTMPRLTGLQRNNGIQPAPRLIVVTPSNDEALATVAPTDVVVESDLDNTAIRPSPATSLTLPDGAHLADMPVLSSSSGLLKVYVPSSLSRLSFGSSESRRDGDDLDAGTLGRATLDTRISRAHTLPTNRQFQSPAFRSVPKWIPMRPKYVAWIVLTITTLVTLSNGVFNFISPS
ncbi:hypothetical protein BASA83_001196 [Batrachochytrium salamandrivorans]|nr:hypothetical protein BASA83_001196 [Batrachochytrium salamandrivorans]